MNKGKLRKVITVLLFILMIFNPAVTLAESNYSLPFSSTKGDLHTESMNKIESGFIDSLPDGNYAEAIVYLKSQVDSMEVANEAESKLSSALTPYTAKLGVRKAVIGALKDNAEDTQQKLLKYISQEEEKSNVAEYKPYYIINAVYVKATKNVIENISYMDEIEKIYENKIVKLDEPEITKGEIQANADGVEWNVGKIRANEVWNLGVDGTGVVVGTIDTGATWTHPALQAKWRGYNPNDPGNPNPGGNWYDPVDGSTLPADEPSIPHGTHVLGTILGQEPDGSNKIGAAPGAKWITAKAFTPEGGYDDDILSAAEWMLTPGGNPAAAPDVINCSWGGDPGLDEWFRPMVTAWRAAGILPVFSAGNEDNGAAPPASVSSPANYPESVAVGATDINNLRGDFSGRGPGPYDNVKPDVSAPGVNIRSSVPGGYESGWSGTSMAAPSVAGTVALILSANNSLSIEEVEALLKETAVHLADAEDPGYPNNGYGFGLIDAFEAVSKVAGGTGTIEGKVLKEGEDLENPVILHKQEVFETYSGSDIPVNAEISDDVSVVDAELLVKVTGKAYWIMLPLVRTSGDYKSGVYSGTINSDIIEQAGLTYKIKARDYDGNEVVTEEYKVVVKFGAVPDDYTVDFETNPSGWILDGEWQWGEPVKDAGPVPLSGTKLIGTNLAGNYADYGDNELISVPLDLRNSDLDFAQFRVSQWYDLENNRDKGTVYVTNDYGETWNQVGPAYTGTQTRWKEIVINLNQYIGSPDPVFIAFRMTSDGSVQKAGWYLEDAKLIATDKVAPSAPANLNGRVIFGTAALKWDAAPDSDIQGYKIYRSDLIDGEYILLGETSGISYGDSGILPEHTYYYKVSSYDYAGNESDLTLPLTVEAGALGDYVFLADFENDNGNFTKGGTNNSWEWGVPASGPGAGLYGEKIWATSLSGNYPSSSNAFIESPEVQLPANENSVLTVGQWYEMENKYDKGYIQISRKNGEGWSAWADIAPGGYFTGDGKAWTDLDIPLASSYAGQTVKLRFLLTSDSSVTKAGWYLDYVMIDTSDGVTKEIIPKESNQSDNEIGMKEIEVKPFEFDLKAKQATDNVKYKTVSDATVQSISSVTAGLPVDAVVTVLETGRSARTNPADGRFTLKHAMNEGAGTWTLRAEAYGYDPVEAQVHLGENQTVKKNFVLEEMPKGTITGRVADRYSKAPAAYATIRVKEDSRIPVVTTDENGEFVIPEVYEGAYTLKVIADGFEPGEEGVTVTGNKTTEIEIPLKRFVGYEEEIVYDDGTGENALALNSAGNGLAIRVTPSQYGKVKGANIFFWGNDWPTPGGTQIGITLYDTDADGNPVKLDIQPKTVNVVRGQWNYIDLAEFGFSTDRDFFVATCQTAAGTSSPGTGIDESSPYGDRSYLYTGDTFIPLEEEDTAGGLMIRARMEYSVGTPVITNLNEVNYTNQDTISVEGKVTADGKVNLYANGVKIDEVNAVNKIFSKEITLTEDESVITVTSELNGKETEPSVGKTVIKDKVTPELTITGPADGSVTNERVVDIAGTVADEHLDRLEIGGETVRIVDGTFHIEKIVHNGENSFILKAYDLAGNTTEKSISVTVKNDLPVITDLEPAKDVSLTPGEALTVSFRSESGGKGVFRVVLPSGISSQENNRISMEEVEEGYYAGTWTVPQATINGLLVEAEFTDNAGNTVSATAEGKINITAEQALSDLEPSADVTLKGGEELTVSFSSGEGGSASFKILFSDIDVTKTTITSMIEVSPGYYVGTWTVPYNTKINGLSVEVTYTDVNGKIITATAEGRINIVQSDDGGNIMESVIPEKQELQEKPSTPDTPVIPVVPKEIP
ncbi:MAG: S8 family serine peptidase [Anaerocolumna sp.]